jgi:hypothetical protein
MKGNHKVLLAVVATYLLVSFVPALGLPQILGRRSAQGSA